MIYLGGSHNNIQVVADQWELRLRNFLFGECENKLGTRNRKSNNTYYNKMYDKIKESTLGDIDKDLVCEELDRFKNHFREIVLAEKEELEVYSKEKAPKFLHGLMKKLYEDFTQKKDARGISNAHYFFRELNIRTCPYCNRHYTFTLDKATAKAAPEFDHFYDKANHPLLAVSFYNLVPSCHTCNHVKGTKKVIINPYFSGFKRKFELQDEAGKRMPLDEIIKQDKAVKIGFGKLDDSNNEKQRAKDEQENIKTFGLQGLYEMHDDFINEIVEKAIAYNPTVRQALVDAFQDQAYSPQQVYDFVWGKYLNEASYDKRPLSKLTRDILEQIGILSSNDCL